MPRVHTITNENSEPLIGDEGASHFRRLLEKLPVAAYTCDADGLITYFNPDAERLWGRAPKLNEPVDRFCGSFELFAPDGSPLSHDDCWMALALKENREYNGHEIIVQRPDGQRVTALAHANPIHGNAGELLGAVNVLVDITDQKRAESIRAQLAAIVESADDAIIGKTLEGTIVSWNQAAEQMYGYTATEAIGRSISMLVPADRKEELAGILNRLRRGERIEHFETKRRRKDGKTLDVSVTISPVKTEAGTIIGASAVARDITERRHTERLLRWKKHRQALAKGQEEERKRIARELHDDMAQRLAALALRLGTAELSSSRQEDISAVIQSLRTQVEQLAEDVRSLSHRLHPSLVDLLGLKASLESECHRVSEATGLQVHFASDPPPEDFPSDLALALYRMVQEGLRNVTEHAEAREVDVTLTVSGDEVRLTIEDNGKGFDPDAAQNGSGSLGLLSMSERLELFDGHLSVKSELGEGTCLEASVPLKRTPKKRSVSPQHLGTSHERQLDG